jgi:hypothetical protein
VITPRIEPEYKIQKGEHKMKKILIAMALCLTMVGLIAVPAMAAPPQPSAGSFVNSSGVPAGSTLMLNITYKVVNDEDSGNVGYWALGSYNKSVQVWMTADNNCYATVRYEGKWQTFTGALSPGAGVLETKDVSGTFEGGYTATFTCTGCTPTKGNIGTFDFSGTKADVLLGTYGAGQTGATPTLDWTSVYFTGLSGFTYVNWGWTYKYQSQRWNNFDYGTTGDILS